MDIAVANSGSGNITIFTNNGNGIFSGPNTYGIGSAPMSIYAADIDGDFDLDLVSSNDVANTDFSVLINDGDG